MKRIFAIVLFSFFLFSCQSRVVSAQKPMQANSLELYEKYTIVTNDRKESKVEVLKQDEYKVYAKNKKGEDVVINKSDIREVKKVDFLSTIAIGLAAVAAVIFVPI